jgi:hypothetical protein
VLGGGGTLTPAKLKGALGHLARSPAPSVTTPPVRVTSHIGGVTSGAAGGMAAASSHGGATLAHSSSSAAEFPTPAARAASAHTFGGSVSAGGAAGRLSDDGVTRSPAHERESEDPAALLDASGMKMCELTQVWETPADLTEAWHLLVGLTEAYG